MPGSVLGTQVLRVEDETLLTGEGKYVGDIDIEQCLEACFVRSTMPHANVLAINISEAKNQPGVVEIFTAETLGDAQFSDRFPTPKRFGRLPLSKDRVRFVGEPLALVIAESQSAAKDAMELIAVDYEELPARSDAESVFSDDGVQLFEDDGDDKGDIVMNRFSQVDGLHGDADVVVTARIINNRMAVVPMEPHVIAAVPNEADPEKLVVWLSTQGSHIARDGIAKSLGMESENVRVTSPWVGGGFGAKGGWEAEHIATAQAARLLGRPVRWAEERSENLLSMQARHQIQYARMGATKDGQITSLEVFLIADTGAYMGVGGMVPYGTRYMSQGVYQIPQIQFDFAAAMTNKTPLGAFRGAGRPQASSLVERMVDLTALELGQDPLELRLKNLIPNDVFPYATQTGVTYDTGDYEMTLRKAAELADYEGLRKEQAKRRQSEDSKNSSKSPSKYLGIGMCCYVEITGGLEATEYGSVEINLDGSATIRVGTSSHGQGHATAFAMIVSDELGIPVGDVHFIQADTDEVPRGEGTGGSRSAQLGGSAVHKSSMEVLAQAKELAANLLEANPDDIQVSQGGGLEVVGTPSIRLSWQELAQAAADPEKRPTSMAERLFSEGDFVQDNATFPFGTHIAVVEVDSDTGKVELLRHIAVDDCGRVLNPLLVQGQQHGGMSAGISQALYEEVIYDEDANPRTTSLAEYMMPSAAEFPFFEAVSTETPTDLNPLGVKGIGESGSVGATPAVHNAVIDALSHLGVRHIDMPLTPEKVWKAIQEAKSTGRVPAHEPAWPEFAVG